jgi:XTP/dITP diphosphohydrolase
MHYRVTHGGVDAPPADAATRAAAAAAFAQVGPQGLGDLLLALVAEAHDHGVDPEAALRGALRGYSQAVREAEANRG